MTRSVVALLFIAACTRTEAPEERAQYRKITPVDLCMEREVFTGPSRDKLAGRLLQESTAYREKATDAPRDAIAFAINVDGRRVDIWRAREVVMQWYVQDDRRYEQCSWIASPEPVLFGPNDVHASTPIRQGGPGHWTWSIASP